MKKYLLLLSLIAMSGVQYMTAQTFTSSLFDKIKKSNDKPVLAYNYKVFLKNVVENKIEDSIVGQYYKNADGYIDSNASSISIVNKKYYCKVDMPSRTITVSTIEVLKEKLGLSSSDIIQPNIIDISDSIIAQHGTFSSKILPNGNHKIDVVFRNHDFAGFTVEIEKQTLLIKSIEFEVEEKNKFGENAGYSRIYRITDFKYQFDKSKILTDRFFKHENEKFSLAHKYARYHLLTITE